MQTRQFDELISYFNRKVAEMSIDTKYKMELLGMVTALGVAHEKELTAQPEPHYDEWCDSCKEYDQEKHCCPRWNKVIRQTLADMQSEMCEDAVSRKAAIDALRTCYDTETIQMDNGDEYINYNDAVGAIEQLPPAQPERTEYIPDTKAIPTKRDCVDLSERVTATFYSEEREEWTRKSVTIADVLDSVCDDYTVIPSTQPEQRTGHWKADIQGFWVCSNCDFPSEACGANVLYNFCPNCGTKMKGANNESD